MNLRIHLPHHQSSAHAIKPKGQAMAEFALTISIFLTIILGVIELGYLLYVYSTVFSAAREAARYGTAIGVNASNVPHDIDCQGIKDAAIRIGGAVGVNSGNVVIKYDTGPTDPHANWSNLTSDWNALQACNGTYEPNLGDRVIVRVTVPYKSLTGIIPNMDVKNTDARTVVKSVEVSGSFPTAPPVIYTATPLPPDLALTKTVNKSLYSPADTLVYTLTITNQGAVTSTNVTLTDPLPAQVQYQSASPAPVDPSSPTLTWNLGTILAGQIQTVTLTVKVKAGVTVGISNTAVVTSTSSDPDTSNNTDTATSQPLTADLTLSKTVNLPHYNLGGPLVYTLAINNVGQANAQNVVLTDTLPGQVQYVSSSITPNISGSTLTWNLGSIAPGGSTTVTLTVQVNAGATTSITNTASVTTTTLETNLGNNADSVTSQTPLVDLVLVKTVDKAVYTAGGQLVYTLKVTNNGPSDAQNVVLTDTLPTKFPYASAVPAPVSTTAVPLRWNLGTILANTSSTVTLTVNVPSGTTGNYTNNAAVTTTTADSDSTNNSSSATSSSAPPAADLSIVKTVDKAQFAPSDTLVYTLTVTNNGPADAQAVVVKDTLPAQVQYKSASPAPDALNTIPLAWTLGTLAVNQTKTITLNVQVNQGVNVTVTNSATVATSTNDPVAGNNTSSIPSAPIPFADVSIVKTEQNNKFQVGTGDTLVYILTVTNNGPFSAQAVVVNDTLPAQVVYKSASPAPDNANSTPLAWTLGTLTANQTKVITVTVQVRAGVSMGDFTNTATVSSTTNDTNVSNNTSPFLTTFNPCLDLQWAPEAQVVNKYKFSLSNKNTIYTATIRSLSVSWDSLKNGKGNEAKLTSVDFNGSRIWTGSQLPPLFNASSLNWDPLNPPNGIRTLTPGQSNAVVTMTFSDAIATTGFSSTVTLEIGTAPNSKICVISPQ